jgi:hypothetical protein
MGAGLAVWFVGFVCGAAVAFYVCGRKIDALERQLFEKTGNAFVEWARKEKANG